MHAERNHSLVSDRALEFIHPTRESQSLGSNPEIPRGFCVSATEGTCTSECIELHRRLLNSFASKKLWHSFGPRPRRHPPNRRD